ncbi:hypothetical protein, partial [Turicimonas muris]|uniref:hypothetical protein n=1 Tax=Turicimonas muris TaxID=1796652 RepID=UPI0032B1384E
MSCDTLLCEIKNAFLLVELRINQIAVNISCHCVQTGIPILNSQESFLGLNAIDFHQRNAKLLKNFVDYGFNVFWVAPKTKLEEAIIHQPRVTDEILSPFYSAVFFHIVIAVNSINLYLNIIGSSRGLGCPVPLSQHPPYGSVVGASL